VIICEELIYPIKLIVDIKWLFHFFLLKKEKILRKSNKKEELKTLLFLFSISCDRYVTKVLYCFYIKKSNLFFIIIIFHYYNLSYKLSTSSTVQFFPTQGSVKLKPFFTVLISSKSCLQSNK